VAAPTDWIPGGLEGRGAGGATQERHHWPNGEQRDPWGGLAPKGSRWAGPIRAGGAESADIPLSDRERDEGFHLSITTAVSTTPDQL